MNEKNNDQTGLSIRIIHDTASFENLREDWITLFRESNCQEAFLTWEWLFAWWKHHQAGKELWLITVWRDNKLEAIAPLMIVKKIKYGMTFRKMTSLGNPDNDISGIIMRKKDWQTVEAVCQSLVSHGKNWDVLEIDELPIKNLESNALLSIFQKTGCYIMAIKDIHYYLPITSDWQTYFDRLPHNLRGYLNNHLKKVKKSGELIYKAFNGQDLTWDHFLTMIKINEHSRFAFLYQPEYEQAFTRELFELTQGQDWVEVDILYLNDQPIAFNFGFNMAGRHEGWRMGYDGQFHKHGPGKLLSMHLMENIFNRGFKEFDFLRGLENYKKEWEPINREFVHIRAVQNKKIIPAIFFVWLPRLHALWIEWTAPFRKDKQIESP